MQKTKEEIGKERGTKNAKTRNKKGKGIERNTKARNKNRAKRINIESRRAAHKKPIFKRVFFPRLYITIKTKKSAHSAQKAKKNAVSTIVCIL